MVSYGNRRFYIWQKKKDEENKFDLEAEHDDYDYLTINLNQILLEISAIMLKLLELKS